MEEKFDLEEMTIKEMDDLICELINIFESVKIINVKFGDNEIVVNSY